MIEWTLETPPANNGRVALVTGGSRGIGLGIAAWLIVDGWQVVIADIDRKRGSVVADALGDNAWFVALDVSSETQVITAVAEVLGQFGRLDALVNNAGIADPFSGPLEALSLAQWNRVLSVNLTGAMLLAKHCAPYLRSHQGSIINVSSSRAHQSEPNTEAYSATKGGLLALTHALAVSFGPDIRVNVVSPGWIDSRDLSERRSEPLSDADHAQHPAGRVGEVEDIASMVAWLLSPEAEFVTGQEFVVDGGMTRKMIYAD